ncbi:hypothetical protein AVDCRST_MAG84-6424, partial [uncultured Microcoleus sp.]
ESDKLGKLFYCRVRRFLPSGMDSEFAPDVAKSDRIFSSSKLHSVGALLAFGFQCFELAQDSRGYLASCFGGGAGNGCYRCGGAVMQL